MLHVSEQQSPSNVRSPPDTTQVPDAGALAQARCGGAANTQTAGTMYLAFLRNCRRVLTGDLDDSGLSICKHPKNGKQKGSGSNGINLRRNLLSQQGFTKHGSRLPHQGI